MLVMMSFNPRITMHQQSRVSANCWVPASHRLFRVSGVIALFIFGALAANVATSDPRLTAMDLAADRWVHPWLSPATTAGAMEGLAWLLLCVIVANRWRPGWASPGLLT